MSRRQVYILGDLARPLHCSVHEVGSGQQIPDITSLTTSTDAITGVCLTTLFFSLGTTEQCDLVPAPAPAKLAGKEVFALSLEQQRDPGMQAERITCYARRYTIMPNGSLRPEKQTVATRLVDDYELAQAQDPKSVIAVHAEHVCRLMTDELIKELMVNNLALPTVTPKFVAADLLARVAVHGVLGQLMKLYPVNETADVTFNDGSSGCYNFKDIEFSTKPSTASCPECGGSGEVVLFNGAEPCSQGCKKP